MGKKRDSLYENPTIERYQEISSSIHWKPEIRELRGDIMAKMTTAQQKKWRAAVDAEFAALSQEDQDAYKLGEEISNLTQKIYTYFYDRVNGGDLELIKAMHGGHNHRNDLTQNDLPKKSERSGYNWLFELTMGFLGMCNDMTNDQIRHLAAVVAGSVEPSEWIPLHLYSRTCYECNQSWHTETNGRIIRCVKEDECEYPNGLKEYSTFVNIPSGKMVVDDDLRSAFPVVDDDFNVNTAKGTMDASLAYEAIGMGYGFCGNTCPSMYSHGRGKNKEKFTIGGNKGTHVAGICTDLWWYSIADLDEYLKRIGKDALPETSPNPWGGLDVVNCKPGKYKITHYGHFIDRDKGRPVYATLEWVGEADPPKPDVQTTIYYKTSMKGMAFTTVDTCGTREKAECYIGRYMSGDDEGLLITEEVYANPNDAAKARNPLSIKVIAALEHGKATVAPTPELLAGMDAKVESHKQWRITMGPVWKKEQEERNAKLTPEEISAAEARRERDNAPYQTDAYKANEKKAEDRFYQAVEMAKRGEDYHGLFKSRMSFPSTQDDEVYDEEEDDFEED